MVSNQSNASIAPTSLLRHPVSRNTQRQIRPTVPVKPLTALNALGGLYNWSLWMILMVLISSQLLGIIWNSSTSSVYSIQGFSPLLGPVTLDGSNNIPYSDRLLVCTLQGRRYKPGQLSAVLAADTTETIDTTGTSIHGYRVIKRNNVTIESETLTHYATTCDIIAATFDAIVDSCSALGYNVTDDVLRIVNGVDSNIMQLIPDSLPVLLMPASDNAFTARYAIPAWDGNACVFRLLGIYEDKAQSFANLVAVTRSIREAKTEKWIRQSGGLWRNGWYEDPTGSKWFSYLVSTDTAASYGILSRQFDTFANTELDCINTTNCNGISHIYRWGSKISLTITSKWFTSIAIQSSEHHGIQLSESTEVWTVKTAYDLEMFISNIALLLVLVRWFTCMVAMQNGFRLGVTKWYNVGIGCLSCAHNFHFLPIILIPKLKTTLAAFWAVGCVFEGDESALAETWYIVYPAIAEFMLLTYSILNTIAKLQRRRVSDVFFGPSVLFFCMMHLLRHIFARNGWFGKSQELATLVRSAEFNQLRLFDFFSTNVVFHLNGDVRPLFIAKLVVVAITLFSLLVGSHSTSRKSERCKRNRPCNVEKVLAIRASNVGGLGLSNIYDRINISSANEASVLNTYELVRLGYVVVGGQYLLKITDWHTLMLLFPLRYLRQPPNFRVILFTIMIDDKGTRRRVYIDDYPHICRLNDSRLQSLSLTDLTAHPLH